MSNDSPHDNGAAAAAAATPPAPPAPAPAPAAAAAATAATSAAATTEKKTGAEAHCDEEHPFFHYYGLLVHQQNM